MRSHSTFIAAWLLAFAGALRAAEPSYVVVDPSERHTTTFVGIPKALPEKEFASLKESLGQRPGAYLVTWQEFKQAQDKHVRAFIRRNDYPDVDVVGGLVQLIERYDGNPFGLTWNGGLAVTQNDYNYSARTFLVYAEPQRDPVHPRNHLGPLLKK